MAYAGYIMDDKELLKILKAVANENRFRIVKCLLEHKDFSVGDLAEDLNLPFRTVSRDLFSLRRVNLVQVRNHFSERLYSINVKNFPKSLLELF